MLAVNDSGRSTGAISRNICGALYGDGAIPARRLDRLELRDEIAAVADDLAAVRQDILTWRAITFYSGIESGNSTLCTRWPRAELQARVYSR